MQRNTMAKEEIQNRIDRESLLKYGKMAAEDAEKHGFNNGEDLFSLLTRAASECAEIIKAKEEGRIGNLTGFHMALGYLDGNVKLSLKVYNAAFVQQYNDKCKDSVQDEMADVVIFLMQAIYLFDIDTKERHHAVNLIGEDFVNSAGTIMQNILEASEYPEELLNVISNIEEWMKRETGDDLRWWIENKIRYNRLRPYKHGLKNV